LPAGSSEGASLHRLGAQVSNLRGYGVERLAAD